MNVRAAVAVLIAAAGVGLTSPGGASAKATAQPWAAPFVIGNTDGDPKGNLDFAPLLTSASDARGDIVVAWSNTHRKGTQSLEVAMRPTGGKLPRARTVFTKSGYVGEPAVAMDARGDAIVVFTHYSASFAQRQVIALPVTAAGKVGHAQMIKSVGGPAEQPDVAMSSSGAATIVFQRDARVASADGSPTIGVPDVVMAARSGAPGRAFGAPTAISAVDPRSTTGTGGQMQPVVTMATDGVATAVWYRANAATTAPGAANPGTLETATGGSGAFSAPVAVTPASDGTQMSLVGDSSGDDVLLFHDGTGRLAAAGRTGTGGAFGSPTTLDDGIDENGATAAIGPTGDALIAWGKGGVDQTGTLGTATWQPGSTVTVGSPIARHRPTGSTSLPPVPAQPQIVFSHGRPLVTWQELAYQGDGREESATNAKVSPEFATGAAPTSIGAGRLLLNRWFASTPSGTLRGAIAAGGGNGRVYEVYALNDGKVYASRLVKAR